MPDDVTPAAGQDPAAGAGQTPTTPATPAADPSVQTPPAVTQADIDRLQAELKAANKEAAANRIKARDLEAKVTAHEAEKLTDTEKLEARATAAEKAAQEATGQLRGATLRAVVMSESAKLNIVDADVAHKLLDLEGLDINEAGFETAVAEKLAALVKAKPFLIGAPGTSAANIARGGAVADPNSDAAIRERLYGKSGSMFDRGYAQARGGGVTMAGPE